MVISKKLILLLTFVFSLLGATFQVSAAHINCIDNTGEDDGGLQNLIDNTGCYVWKDNNFMWDAYDESYSYVVGNGGNPTLSTLAHTIGFLTDLGVMDDTTEYDFYNNAGVDIGSLTLLMKVDVGGGETGLWDIGDDVAHFMTVKASNGFKLYTFAEGASSGSWSTEDIGHDMSNISWWQGTGGIVTQQCFDCEPIPEPQSILILSAALLGLFINRRKLFK